MSFILLNISQYSEQQGTKQGQGATAADEIVPSRLDLRVGKVISAQMVGKL